MGRPPDRNENDRNAWGPDLSPRRFRPESRPVRVARTVRDMFTRGPKRRVLTNGPEGSPGSGNPVPATPAWLNSPPPAGSTVAGMERGARTPRGGSAPGRSGPSGPLYPNDRGPGGRGPDDERRGGPFGPPDRGPATSGRASQRWQPPEWLPSAPPPDGYGGGRMDGPAQPGRSGYEGFDAPFGASGEYGAYGPPPGAQQPYGQSAPEYVPPLTGKVASMAGGWGGAGSATELDAYGPHGAPPHAPSLPASVAHAGISSSSVTTGEYVPGGSSAPVWEQAPAPVYSRNEDAQPYFWEKANRAPRIPIWATAARWLVMAALLVVSFLSAAYAGLSAYAASNLIYAPQVVATTSPADFHMDYKDVTFVSRVDKKANAAALELSGWFIPGIDAQGHETTARTIIVTHGMVNGARTNRADSTVGLLPLSVALAKRGFAVLVFDMRGSGESPAAPLSMGLYEQYDVLGAVDFLQNGDLPFPKLGRPKVIGGWGVSIGAAALLLAAANQNSSISAVVADSAYSDALPILQREIPKRSGLPASFTPGVLKAAQLMYGIDFSKVRPVDVVAAIAPRPILFIQGANDTYVPTGDLNTLASAAQQGSGAQVSTWSVPGAGYEQAYKVEGQAYVDKVVGFFNTSLVVPK